MNVFKLWEIVPDSVERDIEYLADVRLKDKRKAVRVTLDRLATEAELAELNANTHIVYVGEAHHRYASEIKKTYFYVV